MEILHVYKKSDFEFLEILYRMFYFLKVLHLNNNFEKNRIKQKKIEQCK